MKLTMVLAGMALVMPSARPQSPDVRFRAAQQKETVEGDLRAAIQMYQAVADGKDSGRAIAARALLRIGHCYEKLGSIESKKAYERVVRQYGDQVQIANEARQRLAAVDPAVRPKRGELTATLLFRFDEHSQSAREADGRVENVATDGRSIFHFCVLDQPRVFSKAVALVATEIATGRTRELFRGKFYPLGISLSPNGQQLAFGVGDFESLKQSIYVVGVDGSNLHPVLTNEVSRTLPGSLTGTTIVETWSPDGKELVFMTGGAPPTGPTTPYRLNVLSLKDGAVRVWKDLTPANRLRYPNTLSFSPDGRFLAYDLPDEAGTGVRAVYLLERGSSDSSLLIGGPGSSKVLGWTPDGRELLFASDRRGTVDAYCIRVVEGKASGAPALVRANIGAARSLGFRPNGSFYFINEGLTRAVNTAEFDPKTGMGAGAPQVVSQRLVDWVFIPKWSPDGSVLVYATNPNALRHAAPVLTFRTVATGAERDIALSPTAGGILPGSAWSLDSQHLYVDALAPDGQLATVRVNPHSGEVKRIGPGTCHEPLPNEPALLCFTREEGRLGYRLEKFDLVAGTVAPLKQGPTHPLPLLPRPPSADGRFILYNSADEKSIRLFPLRSENERELLQAGADEAVQAVDWVGSDAFAYGRFRSGRASYWIRNLENGAEIELRGMDLSRVVFRNNVVAFMSFHPSGREVVWVSDEGKNEVWVLENVVPARNASARK
jgi:WD40 repeat protein